QSDSAVIGKPFNADQQSSSCQHVKPQLSPQPVMCRGRSLIGFEDRAIHVRKCRIRQIHGDVNTLITLCRGVEAGFAGLEYGFPRWLIRSDCLPSIVRIWAFASGTSTIPGLLLRASCSRLNHANTFSTNTGNPT